MSLRHIRWRAAEAGQKLTDEERAQFENTGFRAKSRMESCDVIKYLNHVLEVGFGRSLQSFVCPASLERMEKGTVRLDHKGEQRWYRVPETDYSQVECASASGTGEPVRLPELPNSFDESNGG